MDGACSIYGEEERCIPGFGGNLRERALLEDSGMDGKIILSSIFGKWNGGAWTGFLWLRIGIGGGHLWKR